LTGFLSRASAYVAAMPPAISGSRGHDAAFAVALALRHGFALSKAQARPIMQEFNARCEPPWSEKELEHKLDSAEKVTRHSKPRGYLLGERGPVPSSEAGPSVTMLNIDTSEPLPGESQPKSSGSAPGGPNSWKTAVLRSENSERSVPEDDQKDLDGLLAQLRQLKNDGAVRNMADAEVYASLIKAFGATYTGVATSQTEMKCRVLKNSRGTEPANGVVES
jgi:hypothetical protein